MTTMAGALIVIDTDTSARSMPSNSSAMSSSVSTATPSRPTSPRERGSSLSSPMSVGRSKAVLRPVWPFSSRNLKRSLVCRGVPKPANWRMVQSRLRYMRGMDAARERILARIAEVGFGVETVEAVGRVERRRWGRC